MSLPSRDPQFHGDWSKHAACQRALAVSVESPEPSGAGDSSLEALTQDLRVDEVEASCPNAYLTHRTERQR